MAVKLASYSSELVFAMKEAGIILVPFEPNRIASCLLEKEASTHTKPRPAYQGATSAIVKLCRKVVATVD